MIRVLLVDAGGILFNNINEETSFLPDIARRYAVDESRLLAAVLSSAHAYESGACDAHDVLRGLLEEAGSPVVESYDDEWVDRLYASHVRCYGSNVVALNEVSRDRPELTLVLANNEAEQWDHLKDRHHGHYELFDHLCSSWRVGQVKPSAEYFAEALGRCGADPHEALMVDDRATVVAAARNLGMPTLHITSPEELRTRLRSTIESLVPSIRG
ncbi:HAD family hydrolase [Streptomyces sp. LE64]|uniref:HAD family hydrolase n=1 Tax=Streptomyces sp. LE64 TaxID=3448653 RepID=UPI0040418994